MKNYIISQELASKLLNYLIQRPFVDVFQLVQELQRLEEITEKKDGK